MQNLNRSALRLFDNQETGGNEGVLRSWKKLVDEGRKTNLRERGKVLEVDEGFIGPVRPPTLDELDDQFFTKLLLGDKDLGIRGIVEAFAEQGYVYKKRSKDDKISSFILDALISTKNHKVMGENNVAAKYIKDFMAATKIKK